MPAILVNGLNKSYKRVDALKDISFQVDEGELFGFIGPDGAGKTTLFRIITTLLKPDNGNVKVLGLDVVKDYKEIRRHLGYMPGRFSLYQDLTVEENITFFASIFGVSLQDNYELVKEIYSQIEPFKKRKAGKLSGGMKQKLALSCALIHKPKLLVLDEPTTGVDAVSRKEFWEMLKNLKSQNITIIVSTPYMDEASLCEKVALIQNGKLLDISDPVRVPEKFTRQLFAIRSESKYHLIKSLKNYEFTQAVYPFGEFIHYTDKRDGINISDIEVFLKQNSAGDAEVMQVQPTIEDTFIALMEKDGNEQ